MIFDLHHLMNKNLVVDDDLETKIDSVLKFISGSDLDKIFVSNNIFSQEDVCTYVFEDYSERKIYNHTFRDVLKKLPRYFLLAKEKNIEKDVALKFVCEAIKDPNEYGLGLSNSNPIEALSETLNDISPNNSWNEDYLKIVDLIKLANKNDIEGNAIRSLGYAQKIGLSVDEAKEIIDIPSNQDGSIAGRYMSYLRDAFSSLNLTKPDSKLLVKVFKNVLGNRPYFHNTFNDFTQLITYGFPNSPFSIDDYLEIILNRDFEKLKIGTNTTDVNKYFLPKEKTLEFASLPYQLTASLEKGIKDLRELYSHRINSWKRVDEGFWVFNPKEEKWYSFGGETITTGRGATHRMLTVDLDLLGEELYLFHLHPEDFRIMVAPSRHNLDNPSNVRILGDFVLGTPSRVDYKLLNEIRTSSVDMRAFIIQPRGITEYSALHPEAELLSHEAKRIRDQVIKTADEGLIPLQYPASNYDFKLLMNGINHYHPNCAQLFWSADEKEFLKEL